MTVTRVYMRTLKSASELGDFGKQPAAANHRSRGGCDLCGTEAPASHCSQLHLCGDCLTKHYDMRSCAYVPHPQWPTDDKNQSAKARGRLDLPASFGKPSFAGVPK